MGKYPASGENGFTLIEVIVSLILVGIMAVVAGMGLVAITKGYFFSQQNNETSLKVQVAMARMVKEIGSENIATYSIKTAEGTKIVFNYTDPSNAAYNHTIELSGTVIQFDGVTLIDKVKLFSIDYYDCCNSTKITTPASASDLLKIRRVDISLSLTGADNIVSTFKDSVKIQESYY